MAEGTVIPVTVGVLEILVSGVGATIWLALLVAGLAQWREPPPWLSDGPTMVVAYAFIAYGLGVIVDGAADGMFGLLRRAWIYPPTNQDELASQESNQQMSAQTKDHKPGLTWVLILALAPKHYDCNPDSGRKRCPRKPLEDEEFRKLRQQVLLRDDGLAKFMEYQRSRQRIARAMALNLLLLLPTGIWFLLRTERASVASVARVAVFALAVVLGIWVTSRVAERLREAYENYLRLPDG